MASVAFRLAAVAAVAAAAAAACRPANRISIDVRFCDRIGKIEQLLFPWKQKLA
jgi:hypothetical protein